MQLFRSVFNGIGSGAGVAWPLFGVIFTLLGGSIGGLVSLALGVVAIFLFFAITIPVFYFSYKEMKENEQLFQDQFKRNQQKLLNNMNQYIKSVYEHYLRQENPPNFMSYLQKIIRNDLQEIAKKDINSPLSQVLHIISQVVNKEKTPEKGITFDSHPQIFASIAKKAVQQSAPFYKLLPSAFLGFVGTFGSIAGCSAGVSGLLTGMGIFTSFAAFPLLGWSVIGVAITLGIFTAIGAALGIQQEFHSQAQNNLIKKMHQQLSHALFERNLDIALHQATSLLAETPEEERELFTKVNQPVSSVLRSKEEHIEGSPLKFASFFGPSEREDIAKRQDAANTHSLII